MLSPAELSHLERSLRGTAALSVYLPDAAADPAPRVLWRRRLDDAVDGARRALGTASHAEREAFERAVSRVHERLATIPEGLRFAGWVGFATPDAVRHAEVLRVSVPALVAWGDGIRIAPYVRAFDVPRTAAVAVVDSRTARVYAHHDGVLEGWGTLHADAPEAPDGPGTHMGEPPRAGFHPGTRGATRTDAAARARRIRRERMLRELAGRLVDLAGRDGWILVGGSLAATAAAIARLPAEARDRVRSVDGLDVRATAPQIAARVAAATAELRRAANADAIQEVLARHAAGGAATIGWSGALDRLRDGAVDVVYVSDRYLRDRAAAAEELVQSALDRHAEVVCVDGTVGERLDAAAGGVAARLRFVPARERPAEATH